MIVGQVFELSIILVLVLVNGLFAGAEIAVVTSRRSAIVERAEQGSAAAKALLWLMDSPERFLATVQVGITVVGAGAAAFGGASLTGHLSKWLMHFPVLARHAEVLAFTTIVMGISFSPSSWANWSPNHWRYVIASRMRWPSRAPCGCSRSWPALWSGC